MKLKNYLKNLCQKDIPVQQNIRIGYKGKQIDSIFQDIKDERGYGYLRFISQKIKIPRKTLCGWRSGNFSVPIPCLLKLVNLWKKVKNKDNYELESKLSELFYKDNYFSVMCGKRALLPKIMTPNFAYIIGNLFGDGWLTDYKKRIKSRGTPEYTIGFSSNTQEFLKDVILPYFKDIFGIDLKIYRQGKNCFVAKTSAKVVYFFLNRICEIPLGEKKGKLTIPKIILSASKEVQRNFISGFFDADGCIYLKRKHISIVQADKRILEGLASLMQGLGIIVRKIYRTEKEFGITYDLSVSWKSVKRFLEVIPLKEKSKIAKKEALLSSFVLAGKG